MIRFNSFASALLLSTALFSQAAQAQSPIERSYTITDVTSEYEQAEGLYFINPTPSPSPAAPAPKATIPTTAPTPGPLGNIDIKQIITIGEKVWDFIIKNKPTADLKPLKASIVPAGITNFTQLQWPKNAAVSKVYRVTFKNAFGGTAMGSFDYRVSYIYGGSYKGKGKFLGEISVQPAAVNLRTDRSLAFKAELAATLNYGTEEDPVAGAHLILSWTSPTTTRLEANTAEYIIYGDGDLQDLTNGN